MKNAFVLTLEWKFILVYVYMQDVRETRQCLGEGSCITAWNCMVEWSRMKHAYGGKRLIRNDSGGQNWRHTDKKYYITF